MDGCFWAARCDDTVITMYFQRCFLFCDVLYICTCTVRVFKCSVQVDNRHRITYYINLIESCRDAEALVLY